MIELLAGVSVTSDDEDNVIKNSHSISLGRKRESMNNGNFFPSSFSMLSFSPRTVLPSNLFLEILLLCIFAAH